MAEPKTFNDETLLRTALYDLLANDTELFNAIVDGTLNVSEWLAGSWTPTYVATNQFILPGDHTAAYVPGRRVRAHLSTGYVYSHVTAVSFSAGTGNSTITLADDVLNGTLDEVALGIISSRPTSSLPVEKPLELEPILLTSWQTDPDQYTVLKQDAHDSAGKGKDLFYKYVFPAGVLSIMYSQIMLPFSGYDLQLILPYRMSTSASGGVFWQVCWKEVSTNEADAELTAWAAFFDSLDNITDTPSATANQRNLISGQNLVIPSTAYNANGTLKLALMRQGTHENDTHAGDAEVYDSIVLVPVLP
jgi:hypothetical protein